jgi:uncharacterized protein (TIGR02217 family)
LSFHDVVFPEVISKGTSGGPAHRTKVIELDSGAEERVSRWSTAKRRYDVAYGIKTMDQLYSVYQFFLQRKGATHTFRFKDWLDYSSNPDGRLWATSEVVARTDQEIGVGDGTTTLFQLIKTYTDASGSRERPITKPRNGTLLVEVNGVEKTEGVDWSCDYTTGWVTLAPAPPLGHIVKAGFEFDVPVRFGITDDEMMIAIQDFNSGSTKIPLVEVLDDYEVPDELYMGGALDHGQVSSDITVWSLGAGMFHTIEVITNDIDLNLPTDLTNIALGGPYWYIKNEAVSTHDIFVKEGASSLGNIIPGGFGMVFCVDTGSGKEWALLN